MAESRDDFPKSVADALGKRAAFICSNPDCRILTIARSDENESKFLYVGKAAHICAAAKGGPRYTAEMTPDERKAPSNGIFLCSNCADMIDKNDGVDFTVERIRRWKEDHEKWVAANLNKRSGGLGGTGGSGTIIGDRGIIIGGRGGDPGPYGLGGSGGGGFINGNDGLIIGGDAGGSATPDGRGGRGACGPTERHGFSTSRWGFGRGASGPNQPEYNRRIGLLTVIRAEYMAKFPGDVPFIDAGIDPVPVDWINQRLEEYGEVWRVDMGLGGYTLPALQASDYSGEGKAATIRALLREYFKKVPSSKPCAGPRAPIPIDWINGRLVEMGTTWRIQPGHDGLRFLEVANSEVGPYTGRNPAATASAPVTSHDSTENTRSPAGIALIICQRVDWPRSIQNSTFPRNFTCTFDALEFDVFPQECQPFAAYVLLSGAGSIVTSLTLTAPNEEILWEQQIVATKWGEIGTWEGSFTISKLKVPEPGIYRWKLHHGEKIMLERPMIFRLRVQTPDATSTHSNT